MAMSTPSWLYYFFGLLMLAVAAYCFTLLVLSLATHRPSGRDVEISHIFMGVAMAGMFVGQWAFGRSAVWEIIFGDTPGLVPGREHPIGPNVRPPPAPRPDPRRHELRHAVDVLVPDGGNVRGRCRCRRRQERSSIRGSAFVVAFVLFASAIFTLASPNKGASHFGSHAPAYALAGAASQDRPDAQPEAGAEAVLVLDDIVATPWLVDVSHAVMCIAMGFMLLLMI